MRRRAILSFATIVTLSACAHRTPPVAMPGMAWSQHEVEGEGLKLAFGSPNSDNVALMMVCQPGSGRIEVYGSDALTAVELPAGGPEATAFARTGQARFGGALRAPAAPKDTAARFVASCRA